MCVTRSSIHKRSSAATSSKGNAEFLVHAPANFGASASGTDDADSQILHDLEAVLVPIPLSEEAETRQALRLRDIARVTIAPKPRRGVFEKDGNEVVGGVIAMRYGHNPLEVTRAIRRKLTELRTGLPHGVRIVPCYDRTPLIEGAVATVTGTLLEAMLGATLCVLLVLRHLRSSFLIAVTLPLAALASFVGMAALRAVGIADIQTNIMSLAGIAISIGVLVDSSIVMAENAMTHLRREFGDQPVTGDIRVTVYAACRTVGRPIFFSVLIMLISFLPVFALGGIDGKLFRPLAFTKTFALIAVALLSVTLVPALCTLFLRGRMRAETESWLVRGDGGLSAGAELPARSSNRDGLDHRRDVRGRRHPDRPRRPVPRRAVHGAGRHRLDVARTATRRAQGGTP